jgi:hypothetical protein
MSDNWHVYPINDLVEHISEGDGCACGPTPRLEGEAWIYVHHSIDGRELTEGN